MNPSLRFVQRKYANSQDIHPSSRLQTILGLDLGKQHDFSALAATEFLTADCPTIGKPHLVMQQMICKATKRWAIGTTYTSVVNDVKKIVERFESPTLIVDASGVGQPVIDHMRLVGLRPIGVTITGGNSQRFDGIGWYVSKAVLVSNAQVMLQRGEMLLLERDKELMKELSNYSASTTGSGNEVYAARPGEHDDLVVALCLCAWYATKGQQRLRVK
jgi:hypothetical protein